jgi:hypothetical protein
MISTHVFILSLFIAFCQERGSLGGRQMSLITQLH